MQITDIYTSDYSRLNAARGVAQAEQSAAQQSTETEAAVREDTVVKSSDTEQQADTGIYTREKLIDQLKNAEQIRLDNFRKLIQSMISGQANEVNLTIAGMDLSVSEADSAAALEAISEGGEYSVDAVADRIMDMAMALAGDDPSKIEELRTAVQKGFTGAAEMLGMDYDDMPDITKQTFDTVMERFDTWAATFAETSEAEA